MILGTPPLKEGNGRELRRLHDLLQQHLRALSAAESDGLSQFITSVIQIKLDPDTLFEWQRHTQDNNEVPPFVKILEFIDMRARASEATPQTNKRTHHKSESLKKTVTSFVTNSTTSATTGRCVICKSDRHPLYWTKEMDHDGKLSIVRTNKLCINCLMGGHFVKECKSQHHCRTCQRPHHTLLHADTAASEGETPPTSVVSSNNCQ